MIHAFTGDEFLATRSARLKLHELRRGGENVTELGEGLTPEAVQQQVMQAGLFGSASLFLDFGAAFTGQAGVKPRNAMLKLLPDLPRDVPVIVLDPGDSAARQKVYREAGELLHQPTPKFRALEEWTVREMQAAGLTFDRDVPGVLADLFGDDLAGLAGEIAKLALTQAKLTADSVRRLTGKTAVRDAFDLIPLITGGRSAEALMTARELLQQGEATARVMAALSWQFTLVARCVGLLESGRISDQEAARALGVAPYAARNALAVARKLDEEKLTELLDTLAEAEFDAKSGKDPEWALERAAVELSAFFA